MDNFDYMSQQFQQPFAERNMHIPIYVCQGITEGQENQTNAKAKITTYKKINLFSISELYVPVHIFKQHATYRGLTQIEHGSKTGT